MNTDPLSRRDFCRNAALLAGGTRGNGKPLAAATPERPLRWGIIGTGNRARIHIAALKSLPGSQIRAACDVDEPRLKLGLERIGSPVSAFRDYRQVLSSTEIDAVVIATPNLLHEEMVLAALKAGKHVLCEKPMATTVAGCRALKRAAETTDRVVLFGLQLRYAARYRELRRLIQEGRVGTPE